MATLLRKVWESVSNRSSFTSTSASSSNSYRIPDRHHQLMYIQTSSTGAFDRIPLDIIFQILRLLGPKEAAKLSAVCKYWKFIVSDNWLWVYFLQNQQEPWDSIFFAETNLRSGYHLQTFPSQMHELSFMHIYGQRTRIPGDGAIIIDGGSGYCKFGWSEYASPSGRSATFLEFGNIESPMYSRLRHFYATIYSRMQVKSSTQPIVVSVPICQYDDTESAKAARRQLKEAIYSALFGMDVPAICAINQNLCYVALDYEAELSKDAKASFEVQAEGWFTLSKERFQTGEILFQPRIAGLRAMGLRQAVALCMDHCQAAELTADEGWFKTIVLAGGSACLPGLAERLEKELHGYFSSSMSNGIRVISPPYGADSAWYGAKIVSNLSTFPGSWCMTKKQFRVYSRRNLKWHP